MDLELQETSAVGSVRAATEELQSEVDVDSLHSYPCQRSYSEYFNPKMVIFIILSIGLGFSGWLILHHVVHKDSRENISIFSA